MTSKRTSLARGSVYIVGVTSPMETKLSASGLPRATRKMSVVVGAVEAARSLSRCIESLNVSCAGLDCEVIVVISGDESGIPMASSIDGVRTVAMPPHTLTPMLWAEGIAASAAEVVALTTGHCFVSPTWATSLLKALDTGAAAAGGPMRLAANASNVDAAIFFLRYSAYLDGRRSGDTRDIAGDNCAYVRAKIPATSWSKLDGFWEVDVNKALTNAGERLVWSSDAAAEFGQSFRMSTIARHRFEHGRLFGRSRTSNGESRARIVLGSPLVPFVLLSRIARRTKARREYRTRFLSAIPYILILALCWAFGEAAGAIDGPIANRG